ncbi:hypothetical protein NQ317_000109 [Molorchus minor]|uniref:Carboxylic ester hydrolase n=1 Tax=Molorchus minor TaxID=1323400 RepID=A0ABQ9JJC7_9CUCU|nr:hypothetical protein NQ317_000109 [Molorchus minor]
MLLFALVSLVLAIPSVLSQNVIATVENGQLSGRTEYTARGKQYYAFNNIPFAKPPVGNLRFQAPQPAANWDGILDVSSPTDVLCYQYGTTTSVQTEDCLVLHVYSPVEPGSDAALPVMFYIFGGGFITGTSAFYSLGPHYFIEQDVLVVAVNYRIGAYGFLATGDTVIPGNWGLKDQQLGLKWVQDNIKNFGGDPAKVTIFGESAGGASVVYQTLSPGSSGLFRAAIATSGSALCPWAYQRHYKDAAYALATNIDPSFSTSASSAELLSFLQSASADDINTHSWNYLPSSTYDQLVQGFVYAPTIEPEHDGAFLTQTMYSAIENGVANPVPLMIGMASEEQITRAENLTQFTNTITWYENNPELFANENMHITDTAALKAAGQAVHNIYTTGSMVNYPAGMVKFFSDTSFGRPIIHHAKLQSAYADVYFYQFSYHGTLGQQNIYVEGADRVRHSEDMSYFWAWGNSSNMDANEPSDVLTSKRWVALLTNFAKELNPTPTGDNLLEGLTWPKVSPSNFQYLNINNTLDILTNPKDVFYSSWVNVYETLAIKPYDTF